MLSRRSFSPIEPVDLAGLPVGSNRSDWRMVRTTLSYASPKDRRYSSRIIRSDSVKEPALKRSPNRSICVLLRVTVNCLRRLPPGTPAAAKDNPGLTSCKPHVSRPSRCVRRPGSHSAVPGTSPSGNGWTKNRLPAAFSLTGHALTILLGPDHSSLSLQAPTKRFARPNPSQPPVRCRR